MRSLIALEVVRRAILDFLEEVGGEMSDDNLTLQLVQLMHRVARRDVAEQMRWLGRAGLVEVEELGPFVVARILPDGCDVACGRLRVEGVGRHRTGAGAGTAKLD